MRDERGGVGGVAAAQICLTATRRDCANAKPRHIAFQSNLICCSQRQAVGKAVGG